jgi:hypothetical protein
MTATATPAPSANCPICQHFSRQCASCERAARIERERDALSRQAIRQTTALEYARDALVEGQALAEREMESMRADGRDMARAHLAVAVERALISILRGLSQ